MGISRKINWVTTLLSLKALKKSLAGRIKDEKNSGWIQTPAVTENNIYNRVDFILNYCRGKNILHIGCTDFPFTKHKLENNSLLHKNLKTVTNTVVGIDNNTNAIEEYKELTGDNEIYYCDVMQEYPTGIITNNHQLILLSEVLEHLQNPYRAIDILHASFRNGTEILVTVPNYAALDTLASSLNKSESIHPDHYWYFSPYTLCRLFNKEKFDLQQLSFGMYYQKNTKINMVMKQFPFNADCIIAIFSIRK